MSQAHIDTARSHEAVTMGQSVAIAVASALIMFTVVGLVASRGAISRSNAEIVPGSFVVSVPGTQGVAGDVQQVAGRVRMQPQPDGGGFEVAVPAHQYTMIETGLSGTGSGADGTLAIPPLAPGHYILKLGMHDLLVTAVER